MHLTEVPPDSNLLISNVPLINRARYFMIRMPRPSELARDCTIPIPLSQITRSVTPSSCVTRMLISVAAPCRMALCSGADSAYLYDLLHANGRGHEYARQEAKASVWHLGGSAVAFLLGEILGEISLDLAYLATAGTAATAFSMTCVGRWVDSPLLDRSFGSVLPRLNFSKGL